MKKKLTKVEKAIFMKENKARKKPAKKKKSLLDYLIALFKR